MPETGMTIGEATKILSRMKYRVGTDDLSTTIRMCEENKAIDVVLKYCFDLASMCNENCPQIVRCKDCKHYDEETGRCNNGVSSNGIFHAKTWFCADGKRKES